MRSIAEIDRDHEGMGKACVRHSHGCNYPACECDRARRIIPNVRGVAGPKLTTAQAADCRRDPAWQVPLAECCPRCLRDGIVERESDCKTHGVLGPDEAQRKLAQHFNESPCYSVEGALEAAEARLRTAGVAPSQEALLRQAREALSIKLAALSQLSPCAWHECKQPCIDWRDEADAAAKAAIAAIDAVLTAGVKEGS